MINQIKAQNIRLWKRKGNILVALLLFAFNFMFAYEKWPEIRDVNEILAVVVGDASFLMVISLCVAWFVGTEFSERTLQSEMKLGYTRGSVLVIRLLYAGLLAMFLHIFYILGAYVGAAFKYGIDLATLNSSSLAWLLVVLLQVVALQSFTIFIVFLIRKPLPAMVAATVLCMIGCNVVRNFTQAKVYTWSCFCLAQDNKALTLSASALYAVATLAVVMAATYLVFRRADME